MDVVVEWSCFLVMVKFLKEKRVTCRLLLNDHACINFIFLIFLSTDDLVFIQGGLTATDVFAVEWIQTGIIHYGTTVSYFGFLSDGNFICSIQLYSSSIQISPFLIFKCFSLSHSITYGMENINFYIRCWTINMNL